MKRPAWTRDGCPIALAPIAALCTLVPVAVADASDRVSYTSSRPGNWDIYLFEHSGAAPRRLTDDPGLDYDPVVSPDGRWLVFCSERNGSPDLYAVDLANGGEPRLLIESEALEDQAAFSPDGATLAFVSSIAGNADVFVLPFRPRLTQPISVARNLTRDPGGDFRPAFAPDGRSIAFSSDRNLPIEVLNPITRFRSSDIYVLDLQNDELRRLTTAPGWDGSPAWSPDGRSIAFYSERNPTDQRPGIDGSQPASLWIMNSDGSQQHTLTSTSSTAVSPAYISGDRIIFSKRAAIAPNPVRGLVGSLTQMYEDGAWQLFSIGVDGSGERLESDGAKRNYWAPKPGPTPGSFVAHGTASNAVDVAAGDRDVFGGHGSVLVEGAPFRRQLADRVIDMYPLRYFSAVLKPDEDVVLYTSPPPHNELAVSTIDGRNQRILEYAGAPIRLFVGIAAFQWSHDGVWFAFTASSEPVPSPTARFELWKARADGSELTNLTPQGSAYNGSPSFSGDGKRIVFRRGANPVAGIDLYMMNADGSNVRQLTSDTANDLFPSFSPTTEQIAFLSNRANPQSSAYDVYIADFDSAGRLSEPRRVTSNDVQEGHLAYSYDGQWLIFSSEMGGINDEEPLLRSVQFAAQSYGEMYAYRVKDGTLVRLTHNKWEEGVPSWEAAVDR